MAWWARHQLQIAEESCCDQLAVALGRSCPKIYAKALLRVVANTSEPPGFRPPLPASATGGVGHTKALERRIRLIVSTDTRPPAPDWLRAASRLAVVCLLPLGLIYCDHYRPVPTEEGTSTDPVEAPALDSPDDLSTVVDEATRVLPRPDPEFQELIHAQELIWEAVESGRLAEPTGREASGYLTNAMERKLTELFPHYRPMPTEEGTSTDPVEAPALDSPDDLSAAVDEATRVLPRPDAEYQKLIHYQELIWEAVESGRLSERSGREASGYLTNAMERKLTELFHHDRPMPTEEETSTYPVEATARDSPDDLSAVVDEATRVLPRPDPEFQELIWEAVESGRLAEPSGREASGYLTNAMERKLTELFHARSAERNRGLWLSDYSSHISTGDLQSPELSGALAEMQELIEEIRQAPDSNARSEERSRRIQELNTRIYAAIGLGIESEM